MIGWTFFIWFSAVFIVIQTTNILIFFSNNQFKDSRSNIAEKWPEVSKSGDENFARILLDDMESIVVLLLRKNTWDFNKYFLVSETKRTSVWDNVFKSQVTWEVAINQIRWNFQRSIYPGRDHPIGSSRIPGQSDNFRLSESCRIRLSETDGILLFPTISDSRIRQLPTLGSDRFRPQGTRRILSDPSFSDCWILSDPPFFDRQKEFEELSNIFGFLTPAIESACWKTHVYQFSEV
jgi:hypothetical protein